MSDYRQRLASSGLLAAFERARAAHDASAMKRIMEAAGFTPPEIESVLWSKGDIGAAPTPEEKRKAFWDAVIGSIGIALVSGLILGGVFVYASSGLASADGHSRTKSDVAMSDYRRPSEAYYRPFVWGFFIGTIGGLIAGTLVYDPTAPEA